VAVRVVGFAHIPPPEVTFLNMVNLELVSGLKSIAIGIRILRNTVYEIAVINEVAVLVIAGTAAVGLVVPEFTDINNGIRAIVELIAEVADDVDTHTGAVAVFPFSEIVALNRPIVNAIAAADTLIVEEALVAAAVVIPLDGILHHVTENLQPGAGIADDIVITHIGIGCAI
jgi:hypothetical protein